MHWIYAVLLMTQPPHSKLQVECFENLFPQVEGLEEAMIFSIKIQSENMKMTWNITFTYILHDF